MEKKKILVVDDEPDVTDLVAYHLKAKGFHVETVNDATASISKARLYQPDLLILDIMMPHLSGFGLRPLSSLTPTCRVGSVSSTRMPSCT